MDKRHATEDYDPALIRRLIRMVIWTRCVLFWEQIWPRLWGALIVSGVFLLVVLFDLLQMLPPFVHATVLVATGLLFLFFLYRGFQSVFWPSQRAALIRLETDNGLHHHPLLALLDQPARKKLSGQAEIIWLTHQNRMIRSVRRIRRPSPRSYLYKKDPYSLRALLILLLVLGAIEARFDWQDRFGRAFHIAQEQSVAGNWTLDIWITPPPHTGLGSRYISLNAADIETYDEAGLLRFAQHSEIMIRLAQYKTGADLSFSTGIFEEPFQNLSQGAYSYETVFDQGSQLIIKNDDDVLFRQSVDLLPDRAPQVSAKIQEDRLGRGQLRLSFAAEDDFGLNEVALSIRKAEGASSEPFELTRVVSGKKATGMFSRNLADHPWAGQRVIITPKAVDNFGQTALGDALEAVLPQRHFRHPVAVRLIAIRRDLYQPSAEDRIFGQFELRKILTSPHMFDGDVTVYLALKVASQRLRHYTQDDEMNRIRAILWEVALRLDEGAAGTQRNVLEDLSQKMQDMMAQGSDNAAMEALFEQMNQSLDQYLQRMIESNAQMQEFKEAASAADAEMIGRDQMQEMLNKARELMRQGDLAGARALMEQFQSILSRLAQQPKPDPDQMQQAKETMDGLRQLKSDQQNLMDRTFKRVRNQDGPSLSSTRQAIVESEDQEKLLQRLHEQIQAMKKMSMKPSRDLRDAMQNMERAAQSLQRGLDEDALQAQMRAVDKLSSGLKDAAQRMARQMGMMPMGQQLPGTDPLGRGRGGRIVTPNGQTLPNERTIHRSREILQELYRRAGQKGREPEELEYIDRLLDRF